MKRWFPVLLLCASLSIAGAGFGQNLQSYVSAMNKALEYGTVALSDGHILNFNFEVPGPFYLVISKDTGEKETTRWDILTLDNMAITADLKSLNEDQITEEMVFTGPYVDVYKPGDIGDTTWVMFSAIDSTHRISITSVDRDKLAKIKTGAVGGNQIGANTSYRKVATIAFSERLKARTFEKALRAAILVAKTQ